MSRTAIIGALGIGAQSAKGTPASSFSYLPATAISIDENQNTQAYPPEVGGNYFLRGAYKAGVSVAGDAAVLMRPDGIGWFLYGMSGQDTVTPVPGQSGAYSHAFTPFAPAAGVDLPWFTIIKDVSKLYAEQYTDCKISALRIDMAKQSVVNCSATVEGITPAETSVPGSETFDSVVAFTTCNASVSLVNEAGQASISSNAALLDRITLDFQNRLSGDEFVVGSFYQQDITLLQRVVNVSCDSVIRDPALIRAVYRNGGTGSWSPTIFRGHLHITLNSTANVPATTQPYQLDIDFPGIDFMAMPVSLNGAQLIRATLSAQVSLGSSGADTFSMTLVNGTASY